MKKFNEDEVFALLKEVSGISKERVKSKSRHDDVVVARKTFANAVRKLYPYMSLTKVGAYLNRSHCTVIHYTKNHKYSMMYDKNYRIMYQKFMGVINPEHVDEHEHLDRSELKLLMEWHEKQFNKIKNLIQ